MRKCRQIISLSIRYGLKTSSTQWVGFEPGAIEVEVKLCTSLAFQPDPKFKFFLESGGYRLPDVSSSLGDFFSLFACVAQYNLSPSLHFYNQNCNFNSTDILFELTNYQVQSEQ